MAVISWRSWSTMEQVSKEMNKQLSIFDSLESVSEPKVCSLTQPVSEQNMAKQAAIQRYLDRADKETEFSVNKYRPGGKKYYYYRLSYRQRKKVKHVHVPGGNVNSELATYRALKLQQMINRGAELEEVLAAVINYRGIKIQEN